VCGQRETGVNAHLFILALGSACYPLLLAIVLVLLTAEHPPKLLLGYLIGGAAMSFALGVVIIIVLDDVGEGHHKHSHHFGPWVDIVVGALAIALALVLERRHRRRMRRGGSAVVRRGSGNARVDRILDKSSIAWMIVLGMCLSLPSPFYLAALVDIAQQDPNWSARLGILLVFNIIIFVLVWVPLVAFLASPNRTRGFVDAMNAWLHMHLLRIGVVAAAGVGIYEIVRGVTAL
jgi:hypothetical protein